MAATEFETFDVIIVGGGPTGLAAAYECAVKEKKKVLLLERFNEFANAYGSSPGYSRQFRVSYSEMYLCKLALKSYDLWQSLMDEVNDHNLLQITGCLWFGDSGVENGEGNIDKAIKNLQDLCLQEPKDYTVLEGKEAIMNNPQFAFVSKAVENIDKAKALYTAKGGTVNVPAVVSAYVNALEKAPAGRATLIKRAQVTTIDHTKEEYVEVKADVKDCNGTAETKTYRGAKVILTPGTYVNVVLDVLEPPFRYRINLTIYLWSSTYFTSKASPTSGTDPATWPIWYFFGPKPTDDGSAGPKDYNDYYGFPSEPGRPQYLRVALAYTSKEEFDFHLFPPAIQQRPVDEDALKFTSDFVATSMPDLDPSRQTTKDTTCVAGFAQVAEDGAKDEGAGFVLDFLQRDVDRIVVFTGGWAMKFVPVIGKILSDLALGGNSDYGKLIEPMNINRGVLVLTEESDVKHLKPSSSCVARKAASFRKIWC